MFASYRGGAYSRAGTAMVGFSKQTGRSYPPRVISFQFNINQGLALEFGNFYMRVVQNGAFVTEGQIPLTGASNANPCVLTTVPPQVTAAAIASTAGVTSSYAPGDQVTLAGGSYSSPATVAVVNTALQALAVNAPGTGYAPGDLITPAGGVASPNALLAVSTTQVLSVTLTNEGTTDAADGNHNFSGTNGNGTKVLLNVTVSLGVVISINSIVSGGAYTTNPGTSDFMSSSIYYLNGCNFAINTIGANTVAVIQQGVFTTNPPGNALTQASTTGTGRGASFKNALMVPLSIRLTYGGSYLVLPPNPAAQLNTTGSGAGLTFTTSGFNLSTFNVGDWIYVSGVAGMTALNGQTYVIGALNTAANTMSLTDVFGNPINATAFGRYAGGGTLARIYTIATPWAEADIGWLKFTESADVMSLTCVNQMTATEYQPIDLTRVANANWTLAIVAPTPTIAPPAAAPVVTTSNAGSYIYQYAVTAVSQSDGSESIASGITAVASTPLSSSSTIITVSWPTVANAAYYNIYGSFPSVSVTPVGATLGFKGNSFGNQFSDANVIPDGTQVPPTHANPFARGQITGVTIVNGSSSLTAVAFTINTATGSGAVLEAIIVGGVLVGVLINDSGQNYGPYDTITAGATGGANPVCALVVGAQTGTYPGTVAYFQERRVYAYTLNNPDTYFMSQPGSYTNFDTRTPPIDSDAITGSPWAVQVNGIQWLVPMPGGLVCLTGLSAWQLTGAGGSSLTPQPITPASQDAQPQAARGVSATVPPIKIDQSFLVVQAKNALYIETSYQIYGNMYTGADITINAPHLFTGYTILQHAYCEEPYKLVWAVRNDGVLLSLTWLKQQEVSAWCRHDTQGLFVSVAAVTEPPVDALYLATQRFAGGRTAYMIERMDNRIWSQAETAWCVDAGLTLPQPQPAATLTASSATGLGSLTGVIGLVGGTGYSAGTTATVVDNNGIGPGVGAFPVLTIVNGVITAVTFPPAQQGAQYTFPALVYNDPADTGYGASCAPVLNNIMQFTASAPVFSAANVGSVIRMGGGKAVITGYVSPTQVIANITNPIVALIPNSGGLPLPAASGSWSMTAPVTTITGLNHLLGATVTGLADGAVIPPTPVTVQPGGGVGIVLASPASAVTVGLGFQAQLQSVYLDTQGEGGTIQGQRKKVAAVTVRVEASRGLKAGSNQPDGSTFSPAQLAPPWNNLADVPNKGVAPYGQAPGAAPLYTGDVRVVLSGGYATPGQVALQQDNPLPMNVLSLAIEYGSGDSPQDKWPKKGQQQ